ncbi:MAG: P-II family nitrogen regulator [Spirochaetia bacterium]|jgi:nitrogen regulatory protein PII|nr:P-II family nitrogen regulator [Spirochaetia bacterium]
MIDRNGNTTTVFRPGKLLLTIIGRHQGERLVNAGRAAGAMGGTILLGRGTATNRVLAALGIGDTAKDVLLTLLDDGQTEAVKSAHISAAKKDTRHLSGIGMLLDVAGILRQKEYDEMENHANERMGGTMETKWKLISVIVNQGYADEAMVAARKAGAEGGTILTGRGTGTEKDVKFFGISLVPEKELLLILSQSEKVERILNAMRCETCLQEPGSGIVFCMAVEDFFPLGK